MVLQTFEVINPRTLETIKSIPDNTEEDAHTAITDAYEAFKIWRKKTASERATLLRKLYNVLNEKKLELAKVLATETGKCMAEAEWEVEFGNDHVDFYAGEARRLYGEVYPVSQKDTNIITIRQPIGVAAVIIPWNFPYGMALRSIAPALAAGSTCVLKPAEDTPLNAIELVKIIDTIGFPDGVVRILTCSRPNAAKIGKVLCQSPLTSALSFTGSTAVGKLLYAQCAPTVKRICLELGGNAALIVFKSADLNNAIAGALGMKFLYCGQVCIAPNRFLVQREVVEEFTKKLVETIKGNVKFDPSAKLEDICLAPLSNEAQLKKVTDLVKDAVDKGAEVLLGGEPVDAGYFYPPTVLTNINKAMKIYTEEIFGPVIQIIPFDTEEEAIEMANNTERGLASYVYSQDQKQMYRVAKELEVGMVGINDTAIGSTESPFGGIKQSGFGKGSSKLGMDEFTYIKAITLQHF